MSYYQTIYNRLRRAGMTEAGALGVLGNWQAESGCEPNRRQGDFSPSRSASKEYVAKFMSGALGKSAFANGLVGFGLAQWTLASRQAELFDFWKASGKALDDVNMQVDFALKEFKRDFIPDWRILCSTNDVYEAVKAVCYRFENPDRKNVDTRFQAAMSIKSQLVLNDFGCSEQEEEETAPQTNYELIPATEYWPPRTIDRNMTGPDVEVLQAVLKARGFMINNPDGIFGSFLEEVVKKFQIAYQLQPDGIVGPLTWEKLLDRG